MRKNIIDGVKPFSDFYFKTCYYHQMIAALSCFGIAAENVLMNTIMLVHDDFVIEDKDFYNDDELMSRLGCKLKKCNVAEKMLVRNIDKGNPVIVGIDCFYMESRPRTYMKRHDPHYILAYGYDLDSDTAYVVDQDFANDSKYKTKTMSLKALLYMSEQMRIGKLRRRHTSRIVIRNVRAQSERISVYDHIPSAQIKNSGAAAKRNLIELRRLLVSDTEALLNKISLINDYIYFLKRYYCTLTQSDMFKNKSNAERLARLISEYGFLQAAMWKISAKHENLPDGQKDKLSERIAEIMTLEETVYARIAEECK